ncbi:ABC transporter related protein [Sulfuricurvum kujiense DSM 16994]|uniref:ABC transporter related protein n=1 Tax=Sulfuricurvum kujiense (strain ATCC BAA-921 / DSM 16994 / JCM 11577 / YK-1) TaxID=709032 RepID=E4U206_SULKY|nr:ATP-binding cassette domain-containing protein [Sulfuricurvum kujiense]ADR33524.1 ABC transporter related protein [Sulfuricurvum kujiense DSM 16994]
MIRFENVTKSFGKREILKGVNLEIERGKTTVIFGVSGGGKSTIIKHIVGLLKPDHGTITVDGVRVDNADETTLRAIRTKVGFLFQSGALFDSMNISENVAFPMREHQKLTPKELEYKIDEKLTMVGLDPAIVKSLYPEELSGGMRKRVGLARTLALEPEVILYDEPTSGLDPVTSDFITQMINGLRNDIGMTSVLISHDIAESFKAGDNYAMLFDGVIVEAGDKEAFKNSSNAVVQQFIHARAEGPIAFH